MTKRNLRINQFQESNEPGVDASIEWRYFWYIINTTKMIEQRGNATTDGSRRLVEDNSY